MADDPQKVFAQALALHQAGRCDEAEPLYRRLVNQRPEHADAWHLLGLAVHARGDGSLAAQCIEQAIGLQPRIAAYHNNLALVRVDRKEFESAATALARSLELQPNDLAVRTQLAELLRRLGRLDEAIGHLRTIVESRPDDVGARCAYGDTLLGAGRWDEALDCFQKALRQSPTTPELHLSVGNVRKAQGRLVEAVACYQRALELRPNYADALANLGAARQDQGRLDDAEDCFRRALALEPTDAEVHNNLGNVLRARGELDGAVDAYRRAIEHDPDYCSAHSNLVYTLEFCAGPTPQSLARERAAWNDRHARPLAERIRPWSNDRDPERRLRIGYVSPDFRDHVVGLNMLPLWERHDRRQFEIVGYANVIGADDVTARFRRLSDRWRDVAGLSPSQLADAVRRDHIDILVDLALHMTGNRLLTMAEKPAPVQATFAGYPGSTGLTAIDFRLTDPYLDPPDRQDSLYSERSHRLPDSFWCYASASDEPAVNRLPALATGRITFGCLNNFCKITPPTLELWAQVLTAVPESRLLLLTYEGSHRHQLRATLARSGVALERIEFASPCRRSDYLRLYHRLDVSLDTLPYNGHTTSLDSLWMGVPVVTLPGEQAVSRAGLSQLSNLGLTELAAGSAADYVTIVARLCGDLPRLEQLRSTLRARMRSSPLMDAERFARGVEAAYRLFWRQWCDRKQSTTS